MKMILRKCPGCNREIKYKNEKTALNAQTKGKQCKSCTTKLTQSTWSPEKRALSTKRRQETIANLPDDVRRETKEKQRRSNLETWKVLPDAYVKATIENEAWYQKIRTTPKKYLDPQSRIRKIVETKVGMSYE